MTLFQVQASKLNSSSPSIPAERSSGRAVGLTSSFHFSSALDRTTAESPAALAVTTAGKNWRPSAALTSAAGNGRSTRGRRPRLSLSLPACLHPESVAGAGLLCDEISDRRRRPGQRRGRNHRTFLVLVFTPTGHRQVYPRLGTGRRQSETGSQIQTR